LQTLTLRLERVFDIQRHESAKARSTHFSFEATGRKHYSVQLSGWPRVQAGDTVTAVLTSKDNWQTLAGWKNLSTGERVVPAASSFWHILHIGWVSVIVYLVTSGATSPAGRQVALGLRAVLGLVFLSMLAGAFRAYRCRKLIEEL
jgi:hypothetical protein